MMQIQSESSHRHLFPLIHLDHCSVSMRTPARLTHSSSPIPIQILMLRLPMSMLYRWLDHEGYSGGCVEVQSDYG